MRALARADARGKAGGRSDALPGAFALAGSDRMSVVIELPPGSSEPGVPLVQVADGFATLVARPDELVALSEQRPDWRLFLGPPRRLLIDKADGWIHASSFRNQTGNTGKGVVIGIIDTGVDPEHGDFHDAGGHSRIRWTIDFSRQPLGLHPELESEYGCVPPTDEQLPRCAIFDNTDLDRMRALGGEGLPRDTNGHGTHVASLAASNGRSQARAYYVGVAPEAELISARVTRTRDGSITDGDILTAARFVFDRAAERGLPAVVNLSLGGDFGAHDGSSVLERSLASMVGPEHPGRAIVVAAGNSASLYTTETPEYPEPLGVHTEVHVPWHSPARVPLVTLGSGQSNTIWVWIGFRPGDEISVALDDQDGQWIPPIAPGEATTFERDSYKATVFNGANHPSSPVPDGVNSAVLVLDGSWPPDRRFSIRLQGHGTARLWVQSEGGGAESGALAAFPRGQKQGTINVPGSHPDLIAVGATLNRKLWLDHRGLPNEIDLHSSLEDPPNDTTAYFSSAGPNALGLMKPDIVAPGVYVIGAMSRLADPRSNGHEGVFASLGRCGEPATIECYVVDDTHAVTSGTSMAAPLVTGAVALLFERDPSLTQAGVRALLQAGARPLSGVVFEEQQVGPGALDLEGALAVQLAETSPIDRTPGSGSWLALATSYAHPDPRWPLVGMLELRDDANQIADGFDPRRLALHAEPAIVLEPLTRIAPGLWRFQVAGPSGSGGGIMHLRLTFDDQVLLERSVPIGVDRWAAEERASGRGGCALSGAPGRERGEAIVLAAALALAGAFRRRCAR